jgi:hypothetical protein
VKKITKWGAGLVVAIAMMFMAGQASAVELGLYETGMLVPQVVHGAADCVGCDPCDGCVGGSSSLDTVVGITCINEDGCDVYWTFFDNNSTHVTDGMIEMTKDDFHGFSWAQNAGQGLEGVEGYLVFTSGDICYMPTNTRDIFANAFMVDTSSNDAVFIPVVPLNRQDYDVSPGDLTTLDENDLRSLTHGIQRGTTVDMRYWTDPAYGAESSIVVWTVCNSAARSTVNMFNDEEDRKSVNFVLDNRELNIMDPSTLLGTPLDFIDGFIRWEIPCGLCYSNETNDAMVFTYINSTVIGAAQTLLAGEFAGGWIPPVPPGPSTIIDGKTVNCGTDCTALFPGNIPAIVQCEAWQDANCP